MIPKSSLLNPSRLPPAWDVGESYNKLRALFIGVNSYDDKNLRSLLYAIEDATALASFFKDSSNAGYKEAHVELLTDPSHGAMFTSVTMLARASEPDDLLIFGFFGHGMYVEGNSYLFPKDGYIATAHTTGLSIESIKNTLQQSAAKVKILVFDACHAGALQHGRGYQHLDRDLESLAQTQCWAVLTACGKDEFSYEDEELGHGVYAHYLVKGLQGDADADFDQVISLYDLHRYVQNSVLQYGYRRGINQSPELHWDVNKDPIIIDKRSAAAKNPPVIAVMGTKGGVGKGTFISCAAQLVADKGHDVAIVDFDLETSGSTLEAAEFYGSRFGVKTVFQHLAKYSKLKREWSQAHDESLIDITPDYLKKLNRGHVWLLPANTHETLLNGWDIIARIPETIEVNETIMTHSEILHLVTEEIIERVRHVCPKVRLIAIDCGAGTNPIFSAAFRAASYRYIITLPQTDFFSGIHAIRSIQARRYQDDNLGKIYVVVNRVTTIADALRSAGINPFALLPVDYMAERDRFAGGSIDYDLGYNELFRRIRECLDNSVGKNFSDLIPDEIETRVKPWWDELIERKGAELILSSREFRLITAGLWALTGLLGMLFMASVVNAVRKALGASLGGGAEAASAIGLVIVCGLALGGAIYYLHPHEKERRLLRKIVTASKTGAASADTEMKKVVYDLLTKNDKEELRWLRGIVEKVRERAEAEKLGRFLKRAR